jgi:hypothetical protein
MRLSPPHYYLEARFQHDLDACFQHDVVARPPPFSGLHPCPERHQHFRVMPEACFQHDGSSMTRDQLMGSGRVHAKHGSAIMPAHSRTVRQRTSAPPPMEWAGQA